jgi:hypothetical protein
MNYIGAKIVKTRKPHLCWGCTKKFPLGSRMTAVTVADDVICTFYWCDECQTILDSLPMFEREEGWDEGQLREMYPIPLTNKQREALQNNW